MQIDREFALLLVDIVLCVMVVEAVLLLLWQPGLAWRLRFALLAGTALVAGLHVVLAQASLWWLWACLVAAGAGHALDLAQHWPRRPAAATGRGRLQPPPAT